MFFGTLSSLHFHICVISLLLNKIAWSFHSSSTHFGNLFVAIGSTELSSQDGVVCFGSESVYYKNLLLFQLFLCCCGETILLRFSVHVIPLRERLSTRLWLEFQTRILLFSCLMVFSPTPMQIIVVCILLSWLT